MFDVAKAKPNMLVEPGCRRLFKPRRRAKGKLLGSVLSLICRVTPSLRIEDEINSRSCLSFLTRRDSIRRLPRLFAPTQPVSLCFSISRNVRSRGYGSVISVPALTNCLEYIIFRKKKLGFIIDSEEFCNMGEREFFNKRATIRGPVIS